MHACVQPGGEPSTHLKHWMSDHVNQLRVKSVQQPSQLRPTCHCADVQRFDAWWLFLHCRETRAAGTAINTFVNLLMTFAVGQTFLSMLCTMKFGVSLFGGDSG